MQSDAVRYMLPKGLHMQSQQEIRYYSSIPKLLLLLLLVVGFIWVGWNELTSRRNPVPLLLFLIFVLVVSCIASAVVVMWLFVTVIMRQPILCINAAGLAAAPPLRPWRRRLIPWEGITRIRIGVQSGPAMATFSYFIVDASNLPNIWATSEERFSAKVYPSLAKSEITTPLNWLFFWTTPKRRAQLLERIKTTFAPEISRYHIRVDEVERPL